MSYRPGRALNLPLTSWGQSSQKGAIDSRRIAREGSDAYRHPVLPVPFDYVNIVAAPASGTTTILLGDGRNQTANVNTAPVPEGMIGSIDGIFPYLENGAGSVKGPRIPGIGVTITWALLINGRPSPYFGAITTIIAPWDGDTAIRPYINLRPGEQITVTVVNTDPLGIYTYVGIRISGYLKPIRRLQSD